jgi:hypothetical protein
MGDRTGQRRDPYKATFLDVMTPVFAMVACVALSLTWSFRAAACAFDKDMENYAQLRLSRFPGQTTQEKCSALAGRTLPPSELEYPRVHLFLFHHEEPELLADWLQYHGAVFGLKNLHIIDHQSSNTQICQVLALYRACGVEVVDFRLAFNKKSEALSSLMKQHNSSFLVPLDTDEFIFNPIRATSGTNGLIGINVDRDAIFGVFKELAIDGRKYKFDFGYLVKYDEETCQASLSFTDHRDPNYRRVTNHGYFSWSGDNLPPVKRKTFYYSDGFINTDQGNHHGEVEHDMSHSNSWFDPLVKANPAHYFQFTELSLMHMIVPSYYGQKFKYIRGAEAYGHNERTNCSRVGQGGSYCQQARFFRKDDELAFATYLSYCTADADDSASTLVFRRWFKRNAMTMQEITGEDGNTTIE